MRGGEGVETRPAESHANALFYKSVPGVHRVHGLAEFPHLHGMLSHHCVSVLSRRLSLRISLSF